MEENSHTNTTESQNTVQKKVRVYLDNCAYNRPYDDQSQTKIQLETQAKLKLQRLIKERQIELASSYISLYECGENPDQDKASLITDFINTNSSVYVSLANKDSIIQSAGEIMKTGIKYKDACHIAAAIFSHADYLISTDTRMLKYQTDKVKLINPVDFFIKEDDDDA